MPHSPNGVAVCDPLLLVWAPGCGLRGLGGIKHPCYCCYYMDPSTMVSDIRGSSASEHFCSMSYSLCQSVP
eukprot:UN26942